MAGALLVAVFSLFKGFKQDISFQVDATLSSLMNAMSTLNVRAVMSGVGENL